MNKEMTKIDKLELELKDARQKNASKDNKQQLRNIISGSKSRMKKRCEMSHLYGLAIHKEDAIGQLMNVILDNLGDKPDLLSNIQQDMSQIQLPDPHSEFDERNHGGSGKSSKDLGDVSDSSAAPLD